MDLVVERTVDGLGRVAIPIELRKRMFGEETGAGAGERVVLDVLPGGVLTITPTSRAAACDECGRVL